MAAGLVEGTVAVGRRLAGASAGRACQLRAFEDSPEGWVVVVAVQAGSFGLAALVSKGFVEDSYMFTALALIISWHTGFKV